MLQTMGAYKGQQHLQTQTLRDQATLSSSASSIAAYAPVEKLAVTLLEKPWYVSSKIAASDLNKQGSTAGKHRLILNTSFN